MEGTADRSPGGGLEMVQRELGSFGVGSAGSREGRGCCTVRVEGEGVRLGRFSLRGQVCLLWRK